MTGTRDHIRFLLGDEPRELRGIDPTMTVLNYLRQVEGRCGTKEGCAEGDCGACTVVLAEPSGEGLRYQAVNSCIQFLPTLDGRQLITVEDLRAPDGNLHPVQQAMVETHASQCGFCTPGFVMSLYALYCSGERPDRPRINDVLAGNLCRCTGYGPIIAAAEQACDGKAGDCAAPDGSKLADRAQSDDRSVALEHEGRRYFAPTTSDELAALLLKYPEAVLLAGSTDVGLWVTKQHRVLETVVFLGDIPELKRIESGDGHIEIGAMASYTDAMDLLAGHFPDIGEVFRRLGSVQIRNAGTIGGNIANGSPIGDSPPPLIVLEAEIVLRRGDERRVLPLEDFFLAYGKQDRQPDEFLESIRVPLPQAGDRFRCYKISKRFDQDISAVCGAFRLRLEGGRVADIRIAYGGMAATPKRATMAEQALIGRTWDEAAMQAGKAALCQDFTPLTDMRASQDYRMRAAQNLLTKFYLETSDSTVATRLVGDPELAHV